jgi:hypothetical protein
MRTITDESTFGTWVRCKITTNTPVPIIDEASGSARSAQWPIIPISAIESLKPTVFLVVYTRPSCLGRNAGARRLDLFRRPTVGLHCQPCAPMNLWDWGSILDTVPLLPVSRNTNDTRTDEPVSVALPGFTTPTKSPML